MCKRLYIISLFTYTSTASYQVCVCQTCWFMCCIAQIFHNLMFHNVLLGTSANSVNFQIYLLEGLHRWNQGRGTAALGTGPSALRSYSGDLLHCVNNNFEKLFGRNMVPEFCPPSRYTGELIGMQYLLQPTAQALQDMHPDSEEIAQLIEEHEDVMEEDEGFSDIRDDPTVLDLGVLQAPASQTPSGTSTLAPSRTTPTPGTSIRAPSTTTGALSRTTPTPSTSAQASAAEILPSSSSSEASVDMQAEEEEMAVDDQNLPGFQHVDRLAEYLVDLRDKTSLCLSNRQAGEIIALWDSLEEVDKQRVVYAARHQDRLLSGRFRTPKKPSKTPGVESTTRCMLGASSAPAQWPDCCRLVESIFIRLCDLHRSSVRKGKGGISRWFLILRDYTKIRQLVVGNYLVMQGTQIQLVQVNQTTIITWHNSRQKKQELSVLLQGTALLPALPESDEPLQAARVLPAVPTPAQHEHQYRLLESTAGQAPQRQKASSLPLLILPKGRAKRSLSITPPAPAPALQPQGPVPTASTFRFTCWKDCTGGTRAVVLLPWVLDHLLYAATQGTCFTA
ncbi:uncharacterized protein LOC117497984 isoform X2 [Trematomus bernacchii]|uniref:uncharacterized protein LOC117497984 isoform X2 n=1 Tax=Trematomus bernacchii TaxID=40690 RepID=UPI00146B98EB|nr:uncharacterized protein LOC117497984 isoform X2 [Trematomus bernacchii]